MGTKKEKKKIIHVDGYYRKSYGKRHFVRKHTRGHHRSRELPGKPGFYQAGDRTCRYSPERDLARYAPYRRKRGKARWRGDFMNSRM